MMKKPKLKQLKVPKITRATKDNTGKRVILRVPNRLKRLKPGKRPPADEKLIQAIQSLPRITNETVAEHREEVLSSARKYIYPLSHSRRRVIVITGSLLVAAIILFFTYIALELYKFQSTSSFVYGVTQVIPFPVAKAGPAWVSYESYLFELRHSVHYYETQQKEDFSTKAGKQHLLKLKRDSLNQVIQDAYVKQLASKNDVSVSSQEVTAQVALVRSENRLGSSDEVFHNVLNEFWGWSVTDFQRELKQQLLAQKVVGKLDNMTQARAQGTLAQINTGADFATVAKANSDDVLTKANGGDYGQLVERSNHNIDPRITEELFKLNPGQVSGIINTGYSLEILKVIQKTGDKVRASHIVFNFKGINSYADSLKAKEPPHTYITPR